jgi:hypothetical protein
VDARPLLWSALLLMRSLSCAVQGGRAQKEYNDSSDSRRSEKEISVVRPARRRGARRAAPPRNKAQTQIVYSRASIERSGEGPQKVSENEKPRARASQAKMFDTSTTTAHFDALRATEIQKAADNGDSTFPVIRCKLGWRSKQGLCHPVTLMRARQGVDVPLPALGLLDRGPCGLSPALAHRARVSGLGSRISLLTPAA